MLLQGHFCNWSIMFWSLKSIKWEKEDRSFPFQHVFVQGSIIMQTNLNLMKWQQKTRKKEVIHILNVKNNMTAWQCDWSVGHTFRPTWHCGLVCHVLYALGMISAKPNYYTPALVFKWQDYRDQWHTLTLLTGAVNWGSTSTCLQREEDILILSCCWNYTSWAEKEGCCLEEEWKDKAGG